MQKIIFEDTEVTKQPYVEINNIEYEVQDGTYVGGTDLDADTFNTMQDNIENAIEEVQNVELIAISDEAPLECETGDKYYNTEDNLVYTAIGINTWSEDGEEPTSGIFYILFSEQSSYSYDGTTLVSVGGGTEDIIISDDEPTTDDWKIWIDSGEIGAAASEITNSYSTSTGIGYSANYVNNLNTYSTTEQRIGTWFDGKPLYRKVLTVPTLPNNNEITITIDSTFIIKKFDVYVKNPAQNNNITFRLPVVGTNYINAFIYNDKITIQTTSDRTAFTDNYVIIEYTKTND